MRSNVFKLAIVEDASFFKSLAYGIILSEISLKDEDVNGPADPGYFIKFFPGNNFRDPGSFWIANDFFLPYSQSEIIEQTDAYIFFKP